MTNNTGRQTSATDCRLPQVSRPCHVQTNNDTGSTPKSQANISFIYRCFDWLGMWLGIKILKSHPCTTSQWQYLRTLCIRACSCSSLRAFSCSCARCISSSIAFMWSTASLFRSWETGIHKIYNTHWKLIIANVRALLKCKTLMATVLLSANQFFLQFLDF